MNHLHISERPDMFLKSDLEFSHDLNAVCSFYENYDEESRLIRHQLERELSFRYLREYLPPYGQILDLGAGTGIYSMFLAELGYKVTALDLSERLIKIALEKNSKTKLAENIDFMVGDARDLDFLKNGASYDAVLVMGPLYHLPNESDRSLVLTNAFALLKNNGILFSTHISRFAVFGDMMRKDPSWIYNKTEISSLLNEGTSKDSIQGFPGFFSDINDIIPMHERAGFRTEAFGAVEPCIGPNDDLFNNMQGEYRSEWVEQLFMLSRERSLIGASRHLIYVGRKSK